ncbi:MAG: hypothetical protein JW882_18960 [Deltaproteobacteria bacterium]|nr:hypothetical protein [Deltaproteobacteria bacterium]
MSVILFPHSWLPASSLKNITDIFGTLTIFRPWFLEEIILEDELEKPEKARVLYPQADHRPGKEFKGVISEYRNWIAHDHDRSQREIIKAGQQLAASDETLWDIRRMIRRIDDITSDHHEKKIFRWNLILHLAADIEKQRFEAEKLLKELRNRNKLLKDSIETVEDVENLFSDFPGFDQEMAIRDSGMGPLLEAWLGLFGRYLDKRDIFITLNKKFLDYAAEQVEGASTDIRDSIITLNIPHICLSNESMMREIRDRIHELGKNPEAMLPELKKLSRSLHKESPVDVKGENFLIFIVHLSLLHDTNPAGKEHISTKLAGKVIVLFQEP